MQKKIIGGLVAVLAVAVGTWLGLIFWEPAPENGSAPAPIVRAQGTGGSSTASSRSPRLPDTAPAQTSPGGQTAARPPYDLVEPGELLVANPPLGFAAAAAQLGFSILEVVNLQQIEMQVYRVAPPSNVQTLEAQQILSSNFPGATVDTHRLYQAQSLWKHQDETARPQARWPQSNEACGIGIRMGQIDSAVDTQHAALRGQRINFQSFHKQGRRPGPADHGTAVAGMLVGKPAWGGLLPGAELVAANIFEYNEAGNVIASGMALLKAVDWMVEKGVQVVNLSVAGGDNRVVRVAFERARDKGLVLVAAAGNWGSDTRPAYPAAYDDVIAVTAFDSAHHIYKKANRGPYIDFAAPGVRIYTAVPRGGRIMSGTSFATPFLTALLAVQVESGAPKVPNTLRDILARHALDLGDPGRDNVFGWGEVQLYPRCP